MTTPGPSKRSNAASRILAAEAALSILLGSCAELPLLERGECGNGVIEPGEQCDLFEDAQLGPGIRCADPADTLRACRYVCSRSEPSAPKCPIAWGCGEDGVCHFASGQYRETENSPVTIGSFTDLHLRDIDGDGQSDLVSASAVGVSVHFGKRDGSFSSRFEFGVQNRSKAIDLGDLDEDGRVDLVVSTGIGPIVLRGQRGGTLSPVIYSQFGRDQSDIMRGGEPPIWLQLLPVRTSSCPSFGPTNFAVFIASETRLALQAPGQEAEMPIPAYSGPDSIPQRGIAADLDRDGNDEVVFALPGDSTLFVLSFGCAGVGDALEDASVVRLPAPVRLLSTASSVAPFQDVVRVADVDGDGDLDVLVSVEDTDSVGKSGVAVVRTTRTGFLPGVIDDRFRALDFTVATVDSGMESNLIDPGVAQRWPLATGDLDRDGYADYVGTNGIFRSRPGGTELGFVRGPSTLPHWSEAVIADFNADGWNDIAAVSDRSDSTGIELFMSSVTPAVAIPAFARSSEFIGTVGVPGMLRVGDFDGDFFGDLAFLEAGLLSDTSLSVLFGGSFAKVGMGSPAGLVGMEPVSNLLSQAADLLTVHRERGPDGEEWSAGILFGTRERRLLSPVPIGQEGRFFAANRVLIGRFDDSPASDLLALESHGFWLASGSGKARFESEGDDPVPFGFFLPGVAGFIPDCLLFAAGDIDDRPDLDELIAAVSPACTIPDVAPGTGASGPRGEQSASSGESKSSAIDPSKAYLLIFGAEPRSDLPRVVTLELPPGVGEVTELSIDDLDLNGRSEILVAYGLGSGSVALGPVVRDAPGTPSGEPGSESSEAEHPQNAVLIFWNVEARFGGSLEDPSLSFETSSTVSVGDGLAIPRAIASLNADDDEARELAVLTHETDPQDPSRTLAFTFIVDLARPGAFEHPEKPVIQNPLEALGKPQLVASDVDRDGLDDLVFGDGSQVSIYRAIPDGLDLADQR